jgi:hypothetical protein
MTSSNEQVPVPIILGTAATADVQSWGNMDPSDIDFNSEAEKIKAIEDGRRGEELLEIAQLRGGLVIETEEGVPTGRVFHFGGENTGDHVKDFDASSVDLGVMESVEASNERIDQIPGFDELKAAIDPKSSSDLDPQTAYNLKKQVEMQILAPEKAVIQVGQIVEQIGSQTYRAVSELKATTEALAGDKELDRALDMIENGGLVEARSAVNTLITVLDNKEQIGLEYQALIGQLVGFRDVYSTAINLAIAASGDTLTANSKALLAAEHVESAVMLGVKQAQERSDESVYVYIEDATTDDVIMAVVNRGESTVTEHNENTARECSAQIGILADGRIALSNVREIFAELTKTSSNAVSEVTGLPEEARIRNHIDMVEDLFNRSKYNQEIDYSKGFEINLDKLATHLDTIARSITDLRKGVGTDRDKVKGLGHRIDDLLGSKLYAKQVVAAQEN